MCGKGWQYAKGEVGECVNQRTTFEEQGRDEKMSDSGAKDGDGLGNEREV